MNLLAVALILAIRPLVDWLDAMSLRRLDRDLRAIVPDWDQ